MQESHLADVNSRFYTPVYAFSDEIIPHYPVYVAFQDPRNALNTITGFSVFRKILASCLRYNA